MNLNLTDAQLDVLADISEANTGRGKRGLKLSKLTGRAKRPALALIRKGFVFIRRTAFGFGQPQPLYALTGAGRKVLS